MSGKTFSLSLSARIAKVKGDINAVVRSSVTKVGEELVTMSPVGDPTRWKNPPPKGYVGGRFRANWQMGVNIRPSGTFNTLDDSASGARILGALPDNAVGNVYYIVNNLPYAKRLEEGWSTQRPYGMVALTVVKWNNIFHDAVNGVKNGTSAEDFAQGFKSYPL